MGALTPPTAKPGLVSRAVVVPETCRAVAGPWGRSQAMPPPPAPQCPGCCGPSGMEGAASKKIYFIIIYFSGLKCVAVSVGWQSAHQQSPSSDELCRDAGTALEACNWFRLDASLGFCLQRWELSPRLLSFCSDGSPSCQYRPFWDVSGSDQPEAFRVPSSLCFGSLGSCSILLEFFAPHKCSSAVLKLCRRYREGWLLSSYIK